MTEASGVREGLLIAYAAKKPLRTRLTRIVAYPYPDSEIK